MQMELGCFLAACQGLEASQSAQTCVGVQAGCALGKSVAVMIFKKLSVSVGWFHSPPRGSCETVL